MEEEQALWQIIDEWHNGSLYLAIRQVESGLRMAEDREDLALIERIKRDLIILNRMKAGQNGRKA